MGHSWGVQAIIALVLSTAFLVWLGGKEGNPNQKFGKVIAWIAIILSSLMVLSSVTMCVSNMSNCGMRCMRGGGMMRGMDQDMKGGPGMGPRGPEMRGPRMNMKMGPAGMEQDGKSINEPPPPEQK